MIDDKSIDMILCDLPYGRTACKWDNVIPFSELWEQYERIIKNNGAIIVFGNNPFSSALIASNYKLYRYDWIIEKTHATGHLNAKKMPMKAHEYAHVFYKKLPYYSPQLTHEHIRKIATKHNDKSEVYGKQSGIQIYDSSDRYPRSIITFKWDKQKSTLHPTQKPVALCEYFIKSYTKEGELVLDNCIGSGTTAVAAINTNRKYLGFELDGKYYDIACERIVNL